VTERQWHDDEALRQAFQAMAESSGGACRTADLDRIAAALRCELPADERRALVERLAIDPAFAEAWRVAWAFHRDRVAEADARVESPRSASVSISWLATAAAVLLLMSMVSIVSRGDRSGGDTMRGGGARIESLIADDAAMPRDAFRLRWNPGPSGSRYQVRVTAEDLQVLATIANLVEPEVTIDPAALAALQPGARVFWQVEATLRGGERATSQTFVTRIRNGDR
jgi:hypothetical protein